MTDDGCSIHYQVEGPQGAPALMMCNSLGTDLHMWDVQAGELTKHFRLVRYDRRGHGQSTSTKTTGSMERLSHDALSVADAAGVESFNWCGLSMGGMVGQWIAANRPGRMKKMVISNTHYYYPDKTPWNDRIKIVNEQGVGALTQVQLARWFTPDFMKDQPAAVENVGKMFSATKLDGFVACCEAGRDMDFREVSPRIKAPTLVVVGSQDKATPPEAGEAIHKMIPGSKLTAIDAAHLSNVEKPADYLKAMLGFLL
jgi:3-oxoadipate enol-lactonase